MNVPAAAASRIQQIGLVLLRTAIGWHFLYEGYFKLVPPAWSRFGAPLEPFSSGGYLQGASGPLGDVFRWLAQPAWLPWIDGAVAVALVVAGLMLMLGLLTQLGCAIAVALLAAFYLSAMPLAGLPLPRAEGTYLIVNKNLIELLAVLVVMAFRTGRMAGLDLLLRRPAAPALRPTETRP
jgi:thiosulfate dehydrogenase [quinone] large subunit